MTESEFLLSVRLFHHELAINIAEGEVAVFSAKRWAGITPVAKR